MQRVINFVLLLIGLVASAHAQGPRPAHIGYIYPAGGRVGTKLEVLIGGQAISGADEVLVSDAGVTAKVIKIYPPTRPLDRDQRVELVEKLWNLRQKRFAEIPNGAQIEQQMREMGRKAGLIPPRVLQQMQAAQQAKATPAANANKQGAAPAARRPGARARQQGRQAAARPAAQKQPEYKGPAADVEPLPEHPLLRDLEKKSLRQLQEVAEVFLIQARRQPNIQLSETVLVEITIDGNAIPGERQIRLSSPTGLTNPLTFQVGTWPEVTEQEPNDPGEYEMLPPESAVSVPFMLNGQVKPGDVDRFKFFAQRNQQIVIEAHARDLMPYLADAVPGWFQPVMALYDSKGEEVAYADDYQFNPDPVLFYKISADGEYELEIRDSIYRGREDFVYRISVGEQPFITTMFPLGGRQGSDAIADIAGWNLRENKARLNTVIPGIFQAVMRNKFGNSNKVAYEVDTVPEAMENEPNDSPESAQSVGFPSLVNGRIGKPGDIDEYRFHGRAGEAVVAEVYGRRLETPIDSLLRIIDAQGRIIAWNDDHADKSQGLKTHYADSYLMTRLPADGDYIAQVSDAQGHGGDAFGYRLCLAPPRPDFELRMTPSSMNITPGRSAIVTAYVLRKDGFDGDVDIALKNKAEGFYLGGGRIPRGKDSMRMTITAPDAPGSESAYLELEGSAKIGGQTVTRMVAPAEDMEQAFAYHHLVTTRDMVATVRGRKGAPIRIEATALPVRIRAGGTAQFRLTLPPWLVKQGMTLELNKPPAGIRLTDLNRVREGELLATVKADGAKIGLADNLIFEVFTEVAPRQPAQRPGARPAANAKAAATPAPAAQPAQKRKVSAGILPAVSIEVVR
ncbi:MAG: hypothetical protein ABFD69_16100 [Candidatus Sumerlaeia bacterium]